MSSWWTSFVLNSTMKVALEISRSTRQTPGVCASTSASELSDLADAPWIR